MAVLRCKWVNISKRKNKQKWVVFFTLKAEILYIAFHHKEIRSCFLYILTWEAAEGRGRSCSMSSSGIGSLAVSSRGRGNAAQSTEPVHYLAWARNGTHPTAAPASADCPVLWGGVRGAELKPRGAEGVVRDSQWCSGFLCGNGASLLCDAPWWSNPVACRCRHLSGPGGSCSSPCRWSRWAFPSRWPGCSWSGGSPSAHQRTKVVVCLCCLFVALW